MTDMKLPDELVERAAKLTLADLRVSITNEDLGNGVMLGDLRSATLADLVEAALSEGGTMVCVAPNTNAAVGGVCGFSVALHPDTSGWPDDRHEIVPGVVIPLDSKE